MTAPVADEILAPPDTDLDAVLDAVGAVSGTAVLFRSRARFGYGWGPASEQVPVKLWKTSLGIWTVTAPVRLRANLNCDHAHLYDADGVIRFCSSALYGPLPIGAGDELVMEPDGSCV